ncbi:hypothetical protein [Stutzerimonas balearica]|uniref:hypothetical protein n=1 Tax=Stutzerimonas balearica TaxID=74829 RepID=UPI0028AFEB08|nr:hypothetical protein [Stutzerimonas balearica]
MTRTQWRRRLVRDGWLHIVLLVVPVLLLGRLPPLAEQGALVSFALGLVGLFPSLGRFTAFKHQLIATEQALGSDREAQAWADLRRVRRRGLLVASLPGWSAALGALCGLEPIARLLLVGASLVLFLLYRIPRQLA